MISDHEIVLKVYNCMERGGFAFGIDSNEWMVLVIDWFVNHNDLQPYHYTYVFMPGSEFTSLPAKIRQSIIDHVRSKMDNASKEDIEEWSFN